MYKGFCEVKVDDFYCLFAIFALDVLLVFGNLALAYVGKTVVLVVLTVVETYALTVFRHSHRDAEVDEPIA